ncbi:MAG: c-type cytochrome [Nitrospira sp. CR1.3]|nr:c-type cytochrome [Nitrospira sp. CR1.3]
MKGANVKGTRNGATVLCIGALLSLVVTTAAQEDDSLSIAAALAPRAEGLIVARCSVCHSADLIAQQRLPRARWETTIEKMKQWGAELSPDEADLLVRYLSARYHPGAPDQLPPLDAELRKAEPLTQETLAEGPVTGVAARGAGLFEHNCQACHGAEAMGGMGPKLVKNPILKHEDIFWETVLHGRGPMPAWDSVLSHQDIADIHAWLMTK